MTVLDWWRLLCVSSLLNLALWSWAATRLRRRGPQLRPELRRARRWQLLLAGGYVLGCGFRSFLPRADVQRIALVDSVLSTVMVGRWVATVAELCFALQWALLIREYARDSRARGALLIGGALVPLIVFAELSSWAAVLSANFLGNAIEQSTWAFCSVLILISLMLIRPRAARPARAFVSLLIVLSAAFLIFMSSVDIPMYVTRWLADEAVGKQYLAWSEGLRDAAARVYVTFELAAWRGERLWMALYFSIGVWISIALSLAPELELATVSEPQAAAGRLLEPQ